MKPIKDKFILLFTPQPTRVGRRMPSLGLLAISTYLEEEGYDIRIYHSYDKQDYLEALEHLDKAICVGITSMTGYQIVDGLRFAKLVREKNKNVPIVWGGVHPTIKSLQTIKHPLVDIVVRGQGEETFYELVKALETNSDLKNIPGVVYKPASPWASQGGKNKEIIANPLRPNKNINEFPPLSYNLLDDVVERYIKSNSYASRNLPIITSYGCPFHCGFCYLAMPDFQRLWQGYPAERVVDEIERLVKKYNLNGIDIRDAYFFTDIGRAKQIFQSVIDKKIKVAFHGINGRVDQLIRYKDDFWQLMKDAGVKEILVGAESGDQEMLDLINKGILAEQTLECEKKAAQYKINIINSFITGYPPTTDNPVQRKKVLKRELNKTVELIRKIFIINPVANVLLFFYTPYPGTPLYQLALDQGFKNPESLEEWGNVDLSTKVTPWITKNHKRKTIFIRCLLPLKKITSNQYLAEMKNKKFKHIFLEQLGLIWLINKWVTLRLKLKFYLLPFEKLIFSLNKLIK